MLLDTDFTHSDSPVACLSPIACLSLSFFVHMSDEQDTDSASVAEAGMPDLELQLSPKVYQQYQEMVMRLKRGSLAGSNNVARATTLFLRGIIGGKWDNADDLIRTIRVAGRNLVSAQPVELALGNIVRRVLFIVRQEYLRASDEKIAQMEQESFQALLNRSHELDFTTKIKGLRQSIMEALQELMNELQNLYEPIAEQAASNIHSGEVIFTYGKSRTVEEFFKAAHAKKELNFEVFVPECAPRYHGQTMARSLADAGIKTTVINDSAIFALMARVNKVVIPCHAVMANGGLLAHAGTHAVCIAAKYYEVPVLCVTGLYKLSPLYPHDQNSFNIDLAPHEVLPFEDADNADKVDVANPKLDYIPPELVNLYVTNFSVVPSLRSGSHQPSYIYRLLAEYYVPDDYEL